MSTGNAAPGKIAPPRLGSVTDRSRLLERLDSARGRAVVWLEAPPGAGKTTLLVSYLSTRDIPCLWYRVDATDHDIGSFFHYMSLAAAAACGTDAGLPRFGPEYAGGSETFARSYFRQLFERIPGQLVVFDDCHEVSADSPFHDLLAIGMAEAPATHNVVVLSRSPPPRAYARLQSTQSLELLGPQTFLLTDDESSALCQNFAATHGFELAPEVCAALHRRSGGWVTGLVLMLEASRIRDFPLETTDGSVPPVVFDYFASEVLSRADPATERVLLYTAMLDEITAELAVTLSEVADADRRLDALSQRGYFTVRHEGAAPTWVYHQLFRQFLARQVEDQLGGEGWLALQSRAARALASSGHVEQAIELFCRLRDWPSIIPLLCGHAPLLLAQGRHDSVLRWFDAAPAELRERSPWMLFWAAAARMLLEPRAAKREFDSAFRLFLADEDVRGIYLAWAMSVQTIFFEQDDYRSFDRKIEELEPLLERFDLPDEIVEAYVFTSLAQCVLWHSLDHPSRDSWIDRALANEAKLPDPSARIQFLALAVSAFVISGDSLRRERALSILHGLVEALPSSSPALNVFRSTECFDHWIRAEFNSCLASAEKGLAAAEATGARVMVPLTLSVHAACAASMGDLELAKRSVVSLEKNASPHRRHDYAFAQLGHGLLSVLHGDWRSALDWVDRSGATLEPLGVPAYSAICDVVQGVVRHHGGDSKGAAESLARARERVGVHGRWLLYGAAMAEAEIALDRGEVSAALRALAEALAIGRESDFWNFNAWRPEPLSRLCAEALAAGIEVPYTLALIQRHGLQAPDTAEVNLDRWPWPIAVRTLGGLELWRGGQRVEVRGKVPRKPLQLLELLVVRGGQEVPEDWLANELWPDADGDAAMDSLSTTILRLRKLLDVEGMLVRQNRCLSLDRRRCFVDAWALEEQLRALPALEDVPSILSAAERVLSLYRGSLVPQSDLPAALGYREQLAQRTFDRLDHAVQRIRAGGAPQHASTISERAAQLKLRTAAH